MSTQAQRSEKQVDLKPTKRIVLVISRCIHDSDCFRLLKRESSLGQNIISFPTAKITRNNSSIDAAYRASNKCAIYGELKEITRFKWDDEHGSVDVIICEAVEVAGSGYDVHQMKLMTLDEIIVYPHVTPLTKEAASHFRRRLQS